MMARGTGDRRVCLGAVTGAHGVRGQVKVKTFTARPEDLGAYGPLSDEGGERVFRLKVVGATKGGVIAQVVGLTDRDGAEALKGTRLYVARERLPTPSEDEFYHADLIGMAAVLADGSGFGEVKAVHNFGAGDLLEIVPEGGGASLMLPFTRAVVPEVDFAAGRLVVAPPIWVGDATEERGNKG